jgi:hypothetical protein
MRSNCDRPHPQAFGGRPVATSRTGSLEEGTRLGDVQVRSRVHTTARGSVYEAVQAGLGRDIVLAVPDAPAGSEAGRRFKAAAVRLAAVDHPHVLAVYDVREADDHLIAAQRASKAPRLADALADGPLDPAAAVAVIEQLAGAVAALERAGVGTLVPTTRTVVLDGPRTNPEALFAAAEALLEPAADSDATAAFGTLLGELTTGRRDPGAAAVPAALRPVVAPGAYPTPSALAAAAREAVPARRPARSGRGRVVAIAVLALLTSAVAVALALTRDRGESAAPRSTPSASAPAARIVGTIPVGGVPASIGAGEGGIWVGRVDGRLVRIDPARRRVVGSPVRFGRPARDANITVRAGAGAVWASDGHSGVIARIDPRSARVTDRLRPGGAIEGFTVSGGTLWIVHRPPGANEDQLTRLDTRTLRAIGPPVPVGLTALDVEVDGPLGWVSDSRSGRITRVDSRTGARRTIRPAVQPFNSALRDGRLWVGDLAGGTVTRVDAGTLRVVEPALHLDHPFTVVVLGDAVWVASVIDWFNPGSRNRLYRIDPRTGRVAGRPLTLEPHIGWPVAGNGALWIPLQDRHAVAAVRPVTPQPAAAPVTRPSPGVRTGPLVPGLVRAPRFVAPLTMRVAGDGWLVDAADRDYLQLAGIRQPKLALGIAVPTQVFDERGAVHRARTPGRILAAMRGNRFLRVGPTLHRRIGGVPATGVRMEIRGNPGVPPFCFHACIPVLGWEHNAIGAERGSATRMWFFQRGGKLLVAAEGAPDERSLSVTARILDTVRFVS